MSKPLIGLSVVALATLLKQFYDTRQENNVLKEKIKKGLRDTILLKSNFLNSTEGELKENKAQLEEINKQIETATRKLQDHSFKKEINGAKLVMLIGETGAGKSTFGNRLCGDKSEEGNRGHFKTDDSQSCTKNIQRAYGKILSKIKQDLSLRKRSHCAILDTPGLGDPQRCDDHYINNIIKYLNGCGGINAFILVISLENRRPIKDGTLKALETYEKRLTKEFWKYTTIVFTGCDELNENKLENRKKIVLETLKKFSKDLKFVMSGHKRYKNAVKTLLNTIQGEKFTNTELRAPIHDLIHKQNKLNDKIKKCNNKIIEIEKTIYKLQNQLNQL